MKLSLFPEVESYNSGYLKVSDIHTIYYEEAGNPSGKPVFVIHGGPGAGISKIYKTFFDPDYYRIILFDQRGSGKSKPSAETRENTTWDLVEDIDRLRKMLKLRKIVLFGGSWGTTLALSYAIQYPQNVDALILRGVYLCRKIEIEWYYQGGASFFYPDRWIEFIKLIPENERNDIIKAYHKRINSVSETEALIFAKNWSKWEASTINLIPSDEIIKDFTEDEFALTFAKIETHYFVNNVFFKSDNYILENASTIERIKCKIIHGRYDIPCPVKNAWELHAKLRNSDLNIVDNAGHSIFEKGIQEGVIKATEEIKNSFD